VSTKEQLSCFCSKCKKEVIVKITTMRRSDVVINIVACPECDRLLNDELVKKLKESNNG